MASQQQQLTDLQIRLDRLEQAARTPTKDHATRNVVLTALVTGIGWWGWFVTTNVIAIKQQLADGGNKQIVTELTFPKSQQQLQANLSTVVAQVQTARAEGKAPNATKVTSLSSAVAEVVQRNSELPEAWQAAMQLVDYKYQLKLGTSTNLPNCLDTLSPGNAEVDRLRTSDGGTVDYPNYSGPQTPAWMSHVILGHCTLNLDDDGSFDSTSVGRFFASVRTHHPQATMFFLVMNDAHVTYSGGKMLPITGVTFTNRTFEVTSPSKLPNRLTRAMTLQLLLAKPKSGEIALPMG